MTGNDDIPRLIERQSDLNELTASVAESEFVGCDTEFVRVQTYWPKLCLMQLATNTQIGCVDILADIDLDAFKKRLIENPQPIVMHAAKQDMEACFATWNVLPRAIFDTQIAAALLGYAPQIGYGNLVEELLGIKLDKDQTRTDWSRRPLTAAQLSYARDDVVHLQEIYTLMVARLTESGRLEWATEDSLLLLDPTLYDTQPQDAWQRLGSIPHLPVEIQARAIQLTAWRETRAKQVDRPRSWVMTDKAILGIAHLNPQQTAQLSSVDELPHGVIKRQGSHILDVVRSANEAMTSGEFDLVQKPVPVPPEKNEVKRLGNVVKQTATELSIAPEILATRRDIVGILAGNHDGRALGGWRKKVIGEKLLAAC